MNIQACVLAAFSVFYFILALSFCNNAVEVMEKRRIVKEDENDYNSKQEGNTLAQAKYEDMRI